MNVVPEEIHLKIIDTLLELHRTRRSCIVRFEHGKMKKQLVLSQGMLAFAESNLPDDHLTQVLVRLGLIASKDIKKVSLLMKTGSSSDQAVSAATGLDDRKLLEGLCEQAVMILASLFAWPGCDLRLYAGDGLINRKCNLCLPLPQVIVEAARRAAGDHSLPAALRPGAGTIKADPGAKARLTLPLNGDEVNALAQVNGNIAIQEFLHALPAGGVTPQALLQRLLLLGHVQVEPVSPDPDAPELDPATARLHLEMEEKLRRFEIASLYEIMSVAPDASADDIQIAYHELAKLYHPDRFESTGRTSALRVLADKLFTFVTGAYTTLSDPGSRAAYDETRLKKESELEAALQQRAVADLDKGKMAETLFRAGRNSLTNRDFEDAARQFKECVWLVPENAHYHHHLALAQSEIAAMRKEAEQHLLKAIELEPTRPDSHLELGRLYLRVNLPKRAQAKFQEVLRWDPENRDARYLLQTLEGKKR
jgi:curved DNA-binding protein CbpA